MIDDIKIKNKYYWSYSQGNFVNILTGKSINIPGHVFTGTLREWSETLIETIIYAFDKTPEPTNSIYVGSDLLRVLESSVCFRPLRWARQDIGVFLFGTIDGHNVYLDEKLKNVVRIGHHNGGSWYEAEIQVLDADFL